MAFNVLSELYKVLGNVELVGAPVSLISTLGTGVVDFFYEPAKGIVHGPDEFARGVASGTVSLIKNSAYGIFHTVGQVTGGMSKGIAVLSLDRHYMKRFNRRPVSAQEGIRQGAQDLGVGIYEGVTGIVTDPLRGAEASGMRGFFKARPASQKPPASGPTFPPAPYYSGTAALPLCSSAAGSNHRDHCVGCCRGWRRGSPALS